MNSTNIDVNLAKFSDYAFTSAIVVMVGALVLLAIELAYRQSNKTAQRELVSSGGEVVSADQNQPGLVVPQGKRPLAERVGGSGLALVYLGIGLLLLCIVLRGVATTRVPWGNMYEFINLTCACGLVTAAVVLRPRANGAEGRRALWVFVLIPVLILLTVSGRYLYTYAAPVMPALQSYWLPIHVSVVSLGSGVFLVAGVASILFLVKMYLPDNPFVQRLPDAQALDRLAYRTTILGFPIFGFGVIFGAIWAEEAWGRFWAWDPKETVSFVAWVIYAAYLHARSTAGWRDKRAAWINVAGFVAMVFNLFFVNLVTVGLHSYAGVS
ncbi:c-type cytochrome biogenesis protein CcsB [Mycobacteroides franklinii]|uniref:Cytochrome c biogenesis protein CcsA n=1 Tax=Mycobacteroides franklinii TaxID=948102 RepID=A0A4R8R6B2_9MYCO|nr:c-type cytochrome biogenesis protein CcsB [Mycobacteroides franklinii]TDZ43585.1 Cytochrome c biogenesis protein CcsA [Mycobacteroides franklinii]TDZ50720.1 Cytochrome c biogenesis protein CcsA [Mycobacteroides franklinii]TDZ57140.1 Cytochrome c biogenesis protein CcsA [Mycobacteroides franklinii]TDZ64081.1 Cytochrome c biogenesis protein CcsA [Mycobacteroides franklinii]TDZ70478.1 Cytochrome c biogenesis protein CcsA [Mycobacteroides franklinii]